MAEERHHQPGLLQDDDNFRVRRKLYVFFYHDVGCDFSYSLYAMNTLLDARGRAIPTTTTTTTVEPVPERELIEPVLRFTPQDWPRIMTCVEHNRKLYFMGGHTGRYEHDISYPTGVYVLDLSSREAEERLSMFRDQPMEAMERGPDMQTGKLSPMISFSDDKRIFVLSGRNRCPLTGTKLVQFEILTQTSNGIKWLPGKKPPFHDALDVGPYVIVNRKVIIFASNLNTYYLHSYDLDSGNWSKFDTSGWTKVDRSMPFHFGEGSQFIGDTIYSMGVHPKTGLPVAIPLRHCSEVLPEEKFFNVVKRGISSPDLSDYLTRVTSYGLCYVQVGAPVASSGDPDHFNNEECYMSVTLFGVTGEGNSAEYVNSAHYFMRPNDLSFHVLGAYAV